MELRVSFCELHFSLSYFALVCLIPVLLNHILRSVLQHIFCFQPFASWLGFELFSIRYFQFSLFCCLFLIRSGLLGLNYRVTNKTHIICLTNVLRCILNRLIVLCFHFCHHFIFTLPSSLVCCFSLLSYWLFVPTISAIYLCYLFTPYLVNFILFLFSRLSDL